MGKFRQLSHVFYKCEYHVVFTRKYRFRILTGTLKLQVEQDIKAICQWKEVEIEELSVQQDHVHLVCSIPPKYSISEVLGTLKRESSDANIQIASRYKAKTLLG